MGTTGRRIVFVLGDQLDTPGDSRFRKASDVVLMCEVRRESEHVASHVQRTVLFLSAMRHHAGALRGRGWEVDYVRLDDEQNTHTLGGELRRAIDRHGAGEVVVVRPGEWRVLAEIEEECAGAGVDLEVVEDQHFLVTPGEFGEWASGRKSLVMEYFYREQRKKLGVLMGADGRPAGGAWNFDKENRKAFKKKPNPPETVRFGPDEITREVMEVVGRVLPELPGTVDGFGWAVTRAQALEALEDFVDHRLAGFGDFQDAMWVGERTLWHAVISPAMNLKLLDPREVVEKAVGAYESGKAPLNSVEGFVRQVIGWREFIRGVYWFEGEEYGARNGLEQHGKLPWFYWSGETDMACVADAVGGVLETAYGHHIARLMVTGNFALIAGVNPREVSDWYLGMYADGVDWVTLPNTLGMAMHADGGVVGTKPYAASGKYIDRMSNACKGCRYDLNARHGEGACPFNTFYWDFLIRNRARFAGNHRMTMMLKNLDRFGDEELQAITVSARAKRNAMGIGEIEKKR